MCIPALRGMWFCGNPVTPLCLRVTPSTKCCGSVACPPTSSSSCLLTVPCLGMLSPPRSTWQGSTSLAVCRKDSSCFFGVCILHKGAYVSSHSSEPSSVCGNRWRRTWTSTGRFHGSPEVSTFIFICSLSFVSDAQYDVRVVRVWWEELPLRTHLC